jgi:Na+/H+ antiporter NhaC
VVIGGVLSTVPANPDSLRAWASGVDRSFGFVGSVIGDTFNQQLLIFVALVLMMVAVVIVAGGLHGIVQWLSRFAKGPRSAQFVTFLMGFVVFIDDYANTMIVGSSMRPITDNFRVSREKLAFLVDSTSAPVAGLAVISTWVGYEVGLFDEASQSLGFDKTGYAMLFDALLFRFYCVLMLVFVAVNILSGRDYGPMNRAQARTSETGAVAAPDAVPMTSETFSRADPAQDATINPLTGLIPIGSLFAILLGGIWLDGGGWSVLQGNPGSFLSFGTWRDVISASENSVKILAYGAGIALVIAVVCARSLGGLRNEMIRGAMVSGARSALLPIMILSLAWSLKSACDALDTGGFLVAAVGDSVSPAFFPAIVFVIAGLTSFATGTSYGTMAILMPTAVPIAFALEGDTYGLITMITLASILDGSIVGDHCSPISDTTIMSSIASSSDHMHHVRTQLPYSLSVAALALVCGYIPSGLGAPSWVGFLTAIILIAGGYYYLAYLEKGERPASESEESA